MIIISDKKRSEFTFVSRSRNVRAISLRLLLLFALFIALAEEEEDDAVVALVEPPMRLLGTLFRHVIWWSLSELVGVWGLEPDREKG